MIIHVLDASSRRWRLAVVLIWLLWCAWYLYQRKAGIYWLALGDTDDNLRLLQVRSWLGGQGWYDLRQYKLDPPEGANIHWSRLVDLPLAALMLIGRLFLTALDAEKLAVAVAPLLPLLVVLGTVAITARRLIGAQAALAAVLITLLCQPTMAMFMPLRIDHHGWQLACLSIVVAGLVDPRPRRGGITVGLASALSLSIGLEMIIFIVISGAGITLRWIIDAREAGRLRHYAAALSFGVSAGYLGFASYANAALRCDALTPIWVSVMLAAGIVLFVLSLIRTDQLAVRFGGAAIGGAALAAGFALVWPQCLARPEGMLPELVTLWFRNIREVKPLYDQAWTTIIPASYAVVGIIGAPIATLVAARRGQAMVWLPIMLLTLLSGVMMLWQTRMSPAALLLGVPGATSLAMMLIRALARRTSPRVAAFAIILTIGGVSGLASPLLAVMAPAEPTSDFMVAVSTANRRCPTLPSLRPVAQRPATTIFTFVDLSPRLVAMTHHKAIAGPYHRNGNAILDVQHAFRGSADQARAIITRHGATLLLICPNMSESTIYKAQNPKGFYAQLSQGRVPDWLVPVTLPNQSPLRLWRVMPIPPATPHNRQR
ncbi:MAG: AcrB/AcrD/AcrF family protein [Sphingomonadaceae bacterium]